MGDARRRGTFGERKAQAIRAGRVKSTQPPKATSIVLRRTGLSLPQLLLAVFLVAACLTAPTSAQRLPFPAQVTVLTVDGGGQPIAASVELQNGLQIIETFTSAPGVVHIFLNPTSPIVFVTACSGKACGAVVQRLTGSWTVVVVQVGV